MAQFFRAAVTEEPAGGGGWLYLAPGYSVFGDPFGPGTPDQMLQRAANWDAYQQFKNDAYTIQFQPAVDVGGVDIPQPMLRPAVQAATSANAAAPIAAAAQPTRYGFAVGLVVLLIVFLILGR